MAWLIQSLFLKTPQYIIVLTDLPLLMSLLQLKMPWASFGYGDTKDMDPAPAAPLSLGTAHSSPFETICKSSNSYWSPAETIVPVKMQTWAFPHPVVFYSACRMEIPKMCWYRLETGDYDFRITPLNYNSLGTDLPGGTPWKTMASRRDPRLEVMKKL